jgi:RNA polymerase sigma factor (sigma-70 family)
MAELVLVDPGGTDLVELVRQAQAGSREAAEVLFARCRSPLLAVIRRNLFDPMRRLFDSDDFLVDAFAEIFARHFSDEVLRGPDTLWPYLKRIAENKVRDATRKYLVSKRYNLGRDIPISKVDPTEEPVSRELTPDEIVMLEELVDDRLMDLIEHLPEMLQSIVKMLLRGNNGMEIARRLGVEPKRVYRAIAWLKKKIGGS